VWAPIQTLRRLHALPFMMPTDEQIAFAYTEAIRRGRVAAAALCVSAYELRQAAARSRAVHGKAR
jgi:hypothetical protein